MNIKLLEEVGITIRFILSFIDILKCIVINNLNRYLVYGSCGEILLFTHNVS